nr:type I restriction-modification system subunit M N-terminal domain-containing protein [Fusobacterium mortiferum]
MWAIANKLRGPYQSDKYKDIIIHMTIIRRFECALVDTKNVVVEQYDKITFYPTKAMYKISGLQVDMI